MNLIVLYSLFLIIFFSSPLTVFLPVKICNSGNYRETRTKGLFPGRKSETGPGTFNTSVIVSGTTILDRVLIVIIECRIHSISLETFILWKKTFRIMLTFDLIRRETRGVAEESKRLTEEPVNWFQGLSLIRKSLQGVEN